MADCFPHYKGIKYNSKKELLDFLVKESELNKQKLSELDKQIAELEKVFTEEETVSQRIEQREEQSTVIPKTDENAPIKDNNDIVYQNNTKQSNKDYIASEKTIRDLAEKMADRIGLKVRYESDRTKDYKGKLDGNTAVINLAYATLDTPIHEILGHPIIRAIKGSILSESDWTNTLISNQLPFEGDQDISPEGYKKYVNWKKNSNTLYQNLLKELEYGKGKEVLEQVKRDYKLKNKPEIIELESITGIGFDFEVNGKSFGTKVEAVKEQEKATTYYSLEEQQEEAIVELLGLYTADRLDKVKDGKLISLLKRLLKEMKAFMRQLFNQKEINIDSLPDNMTLGDIADLLAYSNSNLILPGNEVIYTTPDNQTFKTYQEASNHISELIKSGEDVDLSKIAINPQKEIEKIRVKRAELDAEMADIQSKIEAANKQLKKYEQNIRDSFGNSPRMFTKEELQGYKELSKSLNINFLTKEEHRVHEEINEIREEVGLFSRKSGAGLLGFINKNKEYEQSAEIIKEWKKANSIKYDPEEVYSRGQGFYSVVGAYSDFDVELMFQNLLKHIEDNRKAGGEFTISAFTKPIDKQIGHLEGGGGKIKFKIFPKSDDIKWAASTDVFSGSVWDAGEKVSKDTKSELIGVSYTKSPSLQNINAVQPNLAAVIDNLAHHHNELGIELTGSNFRLEYDKDVPYSTKKLINSINSILDQKFGKLVEPEITNNPKQPTQTKENLKESIESVKENIVHKPKEKEYTSQALINTKIAALKKASKKYPRSLIRSEVRQSSMSPHTVNDLFKDELPFQKVQNSEKIENLKKEREKLINENSYLRQESNNLSSLRDPNGIKYLTDNPNLQGPIWKDGKLQHAQVFLPHNILKNIPGSENMSGAELKEILGDNLNEIIGYRIPNQGLSSIDALEIVGILPASYGDMIMTYTEVTGKTGSDFDVDKMFVMMPNLEVSTDGEVRKVPYDSSNPSKEGLQNHLLHLYTNILSSEDTYEEYISPLDSEFLKEDAYIVSFLSDIDNSNTSVEEFKNLSRKDQIKLAEKHFNNTTNLQFYTPTFQLKTKVRNTAGKAGTGQSSNHLVHHVLAQLSGLKINQNIGLGDQTDLSKVYSSDNRKINQTISAYLNAYVDNAKDPFISLINNNTFTANTTFYMLRAGISPEIVNRFISQPILKDLSKAHFNEKSKVKNKNIIFTSNINVELEGLTVTESNRVPSTVTTTINKYTNTKLFDRDEMKTLAGMVASSELNVSDLNESMLEDLLIEPDKNSNEYIQKQLEILGLFLKVQKGASVLNDVMKATKADTKGAYGTFVEGIAIEELQKEIRESGNVENFDKLFTNTSIGAYDKFGLKMSKQLFDSKMINRTPGFKSILKSVYYAVGKDGEYLTDVEFNNKIAKEYYRYVSSGIDLFKIDKTDREYLFTELPKKLEVLKDKYKDNLFIKTLSIKQVPGKYNFIAIQSSQISQSDNNNLLVQAWQKALESEDIELSGLAEDLIKYAYYGSGFKKNINSFYELIPSDWLNNIKENNYKTFYEDLLKDLQTEVIDNNFINQLIRHNPNDKDLVTTVKKVKAVNGGIIIDSKSIPSNLISNNELTPYKKYVRTTQKVPDTDEIITSIYEYQSTDKAGNVYYQSLQKLGYSEKSNIIVEYNYLGEAESFIYKNPIKMDLPKEFIHKPVIKFDFIEEVINEDKFTYKDLTVDGKQVIFTIEETPNGFATYVVNKVGNKKEVGLPISKVGSYTTKEATRFAATRYLNEIGYESLMNTLKSDNC